MTARRAHFWSAIGLGVLLSGTTWTPADACDRCHGPVARPCVEVKHAPPAPKVVEKTVLVPEWGTEMRKVTVTEYRPEERERSVIVTRHIPETTTVEEKYTVIERHPRTREVTQQVMVPVTRYEEKPFAVRVPVWHNVKEKYTVRVPQWKEVEKTVQVRVPVWRDVERPCTVMVPHREVHKGTRLVARTVPVKETRTVCRDEGHWEKRQVKAACAAPRRGLLGRHLPCRGCAACGRTCGHCHGCRHGDPCHETKAATVTQRVWVPNLVKHQVEATVYRCQMVQEPYECVKTVYRPEVRMRKVRVCDYKLEARVVKSRVCEYRVEQRERTRRVCHFETRHETRKVPVCHYEPRQQTRTVHYIECIPTQKTRTRKVTTYKVVHEKKTETCTVMVPHRVEKEVPVRVCRMVKKTISVPAPAACGCHRCVKTRWSGLFGPGC